MTAAIVVVLLALGVFFRVVAAVGFVRLPDVYCRMHVTGILDTLGAPLVLLALAIDAGPSFTAAKLLLMIVLLFRNAPLIGHLLSRAAMESGHHPVLVRDDVETADTTSEEPS